MPDITLEINSATPIALNYGYGAVFATVENLEALLNELVEYESDESAQAGGVASGGWYIASDNHVSAAGGTLKQNRL